MSELAIIANLFNDYKEKVLPKNCSPIQMQECRRAFYAGAHGLFYAVMNSLSDGDEITQDDEILMKGIAVELDNFAKSVVAGRN